MIQVNSVVKQYGPQMVFENASFLVSKGEKIGFVGRNGSGKSTLFKMILGDEAPDSGTISVPKNYKIGALEQHISFSEDTVIKECSLSLSEEEKYDTYKAEKILFGLGFEKTDMDKPPSTFSGGYQIRINLAKALLTNPDLLLLDEPTNYLDIVSLRWLRSFLKNFQGEVIIITHDRDFMNSVCSHTMGVIRKTIKKYKGSTQKFYEKIALDDEIYEKTKINQEKKIKEMTEVVDRFRAKASKASMAQSKLKMIQKMDKMDDLENDKMLGFKFTYSECPGKTILEAQDLSFAYPGGDELISNLNISISREDKIGIIGKNGKGKSTLLNLLASELNPINGSIKTHPSFKKGHFGQTNISRLSPEMTIIDEITSVNQKLPHSRIRGICGTMLFEGELAKKKIKVLSGGERSRVMLGKILANETNILLLDEPTNHLDMESIEALSIEIKKYKGAALIVTHSEMLLRDVATKLIIFHKGKCEFFDGNYDEFLEKIGWEEEESSKASTPTKPKLSKQDAKRLRQEIILERSKTLKPLRKSVEDAELEITKLEELIEQNNAEIIELSGSGDGLKIGELSKVVGESEQKIEELFLQLESDSEKLTQLESEFETRLEGL